MTEEQLDHWFTYHPPTDETSPKYAAIAAAEIALALIFRDQTHLVDAGESPNFQEITYAIRGYADVINRDAPDSADKTAAIRCVRLGRMAANECLVAIKDCRKMAAIELSKLAQAEWTKARWQACAAIACEGK